MINHLLVVEDVSLSEAEGRSTRVQVVPLVVRIGNPDVHVFVFIAVRMSDEGCLPVIVQIRVSHGDAVTSVCDIKKSIVVVFVVVQVRPKLNMVDPYAMRSLYSDRIASVSKDFVNL